MKPQRGSRGIDVLLLLTSALDGGEWLTLPGRFTTVKENRYLLYRRMGGHQNRSGRLRKISSPPGFDPRTIQPVASHYTYYSIPAHHKLC